MKYGLQVYSVRDAFSQAPLETLQKLKNMGYKHVELYGPLVRPANELKVMCEAAGLTVPSSMFLYETLRDDLEAVIADCQTLGNHLAICPWLAEIYRTHEGYQQVAAVLEHAANELASVGVMLCYHNHSFEFAPLSSGGCGMDILIANTSKLQFEPDVYWLAHAGIDPIAHIHNIISRVSVIHLKDMTAAPSKNFTEVGSGVLHMSKIIDFAKETEIEYAFVEQDTNWMANDPFASVEESFQWLVNHDQSARKYSTSTNQEIRTS